MSPNDERTSIAKYWSSFYARQSVSPPSGPSPFAVWVDQQLEPAVSIVEVGCGNGRDASFFARQGRQVVAFDQSQEAIDLLLQMAKSKGLTELTADAVSVERLAVDAQPENVRQALNHNTLAVYSRFFLHAITEEAQANFLTWLTSFLAVGELCYLEYRAAELTDSPYEFGDHYRRPVAASELAGQCRELGFSVVSSNESDDYAPYGHERPLVGRTVIRLS